MSPRGTWFLVVLAATATGLTQAGVPDTGHTKHYLSDLVSVEKSVSESESARLSHPAEAQKAWRELNGSLQALAVERAQVGDVNGAIEAFARKWKLDEAIHGVERIGNERADLVAIDGSHALDAVTAIAKAARSRQIVILNEAHHVPFDRILAMRLARALRKEGFEYLACETFFIDDEHVLDRGYVVEKTGFYTREPTFAKFLLDAKSDGWKFISYEPEAPLGERESGMARNLIKRIFANEPKAKVFIYGGYSHAKKLPASLRDDDDSWLAAQIWRLTGIDPLTVNQTTLFAQYAGEQQSRYYRHALKKLNGKRAPVVLVGKDSKPVRLSLDGFAYDFEVVHPAYIDDPKTLRPEWLSWDFRPYDIPHDLLPMKTRRAIYAYSSETDADAVPLDAVVLQPGRAAPKLMLPAGKYVFEYEDDK